jgi:hypothetical protein
MTPTEIRSHSHHCHASRLPTWLGDDLGEATYAQMIRPDEEIIAGNNQRFRVVDVVPFEEEDESPFVGLLEVEAA